MASSVAPSKALRAVLIGLVLIGGAATAVAFGFEPWLRARIESAAAQRGIALQYEDFEASWGQLVLHRVTFQQERPLRVQGNVRRVVIQLDGFQPRSIVLETPIIDLLATSQEVLAELNAANPEPTAGSSTPPPVTATEMTLNWRAASSETPLASLTDSTFSHSAAATVLQGNAVVAGLTLGTLQLSWDREAKTAQLAATSSAWPTLRLAGSAKFGADPLFVTVTLPEMPVPLPLSLLFGVPALKAASVSARIELRWPFGLSMQTPNGTASLTLKNFEPPHPVELQGYDFGPQTDVVTDFSLSRDHKKIALKNIRVQAGSFALTGEGAIDAARARATLRGGLSCAVLAKAAAEAQVGSVFGKWAGQLAGKLALMHVEGKVAIEIDGELPFEGMPIPKVEKRVLPGCGLKPLKLEELAKLQPPQLDLAQLGAMLGQALPELGKLPPAPNLLPDPSAKPAPLPPFPGLTLPGFGKSKQLAPAPSASAQP